AVDHLSSLLSTNCTAYRVGEGRDPGCPPCWSREWSSITRMAVRVVEPRLVVSGDVCRGAITPRTIRPGTLLSAQAYGPVARVPRGAHVPLGHGSPRTVGLGLLG